MHRLSGSRGRAEDKDDNPNRTPYRCHREHNKTAIITMSSATEDDGKTDEDEKEKDDDDDDLYGVNKHYVHAAAAYSLCSYNKQTKIKWQYSTDLLLFYLALSPDVTAACV